MKATLFLALIALLSIASPAVAGPEKARTAASAPESAKALSAEELALQAELEKFFDEQYSHIQEVSIREVKVHAADGRLVKKFRTVNGQIPAGKLPKGAEHLMDDNGVAYYMISR
jgi:hypothetical protein